MHRYLAPLLVVLILLLPYPARADDPLAGPDPEPGVPVYAWRTDTTTESSFFHPAGWEVNSAVRFRYGGRVVLRDLGSQDEVPLTLSVDMGVEMIPPTLDLVLYGMRRQVESWPGGIWQADGVPTTVDNVVAGTVVYTQPAQLFRAEYERPGSLPMAEMGLATAGPNRHHVVRLTGSPQVIENRWEELLPVLLSFQVNVDPVP